MASGRDGREPGDALVLHVEDGLYLEDIDGELHLMDGTSDWLVRSHPYEPSTFLSDGDGLCVVIHNAFDVDDIRRVAETGGTLESASGNVHGIGRLMRLLRMAVGFRPEVDLSYLEGRMLADVLRGLGAFGTDSAVPIDATGFRMVRGSLCGSGGRGERIVLTDDGRLFLRTREGPPSKGLRT